MADNKTLYLKWIQNLFYLQCVALVGALIVKLPFMGAWFGWIIRIISILTVIAIYKLSPINERYRKAAIFMGIYIVSGFFVKGLAIIAFVGAICSIIAMYQEDIGHSEVMIGIDDKLSKNWRRLFHWNFWGSLVVSVIAAICAIAVAVAATAEVDVIVRGIEAITDGYGIILSIVYLVLLKRTRDAYDKFEPMEEEVVADEV